MYRRITEHFAVAGELTPAELEAAARAGFKTVIGFRPDGEAPGQCTAAETGAAAAALGLDYVHIPAAKHDVFTDNIVEAARKVLETNSGPVLAHCASGQRALMVWAAARARSEPPERVLDALSRAGFDFSFLRDDLDAQADRCRWQGVLPSTNSVRGL